MDAARVIVVVAPTLFLLPRLRRYRGYALRRMILLAQPVRGHDADDLLTHELCHVWQMQHRPLHSLWTWLTAPYRENPYEREARAAVAQTRLAGGAGSGDGAGARRDRVEQR